MRTLMIAGFALAATAFSGSADAQRVASHGGAWRGGTTTAPTWRGGTNTQWRGGTNTWRGNTGGTQWHGNSGGNQWHGTQTGYRSRWGGNINGHWSGGMHAPGGWNAYHRPSRGWRVPSYWISPSFFIGDYGSYGLSQPPYGYNWSRYYDDAVLIDGGGQVWDTASGIDWDGGYGEGGYGGEGGYADGYDGGDGQPGYAGQGQGYEGQGYDSRAYDSRSYDRGDYQRRSNGVGGAIVGGVVGGVAGNVIAGRGNRTAGTLIGAGVGAAAGYAIDRSNDRGRYPAPPPRPGYGAQYGQPGYGDHDGYGYQQEPQVVYAPPREVVQPTRSRSGYSSSSGGYASGGYWYPPTTTTTVTVQSSPVVTTTTTEYIEETATPVHRKWHPKKVWRKPVVRCTCSCSTVCR